MKEGKILTLANVLDEPIPEVNWMVGGMFARGDLVLFFGQPGSMKSFLLLDMALHLAGGQRWLGYHVKEPSYVLYIDEEMVEIRTRQRIQRIAKALDFRPEGERLIVMSYFGMKLQDDDLKAMLKIYSKEYGRLPEVIIIESLRRTMVGDENNAADVNRTWESCYNLKAGGMTVVVSHHTRKDSADIESGSGYLKGGVDTSFSVKKKKGDNLVTIRHQKDRDIRDGGDLQVIVTDLGPHEIDPIRFDRKGAQEKKGDETEEYIVKFLLVVHHTDHKG